MAARKRVGIQLAKFAAGVGDVDAIITSWGLRIDREVIGAMRHCTVIGVGSVGVDMVDLEAATEVTNVPDEFIEEVADYALMLLLSVSRLTPVMQSLAREVALVLRGRWPMSCVNPTVLPRVELARWQPYPMSRGPNR